MVNESRTTDMTIRVGFDTVQGPHDGAFTPTMRNDRLERIPNITHIASSATDYETSVESSATSQSAKRSDTGVLDAFDPGALPLAVAIGVAALVIVRVSNRLFQRLSERIVERRLALKQASAFVAFVVYVVAAIAAFDNLFDLSSEAMLALSGTLAVTVGFGLKDVAASFLAGILILINRPFQVGDRISFGGYYGEVTEIGLRTVRLVTLDDNLVTIPTGQFLTGSVASANAGALDCMVVNSFYISPSADHKRAKEIVEDALLASKYLYLGKPFTVLVSTRLSDDGAVIVELTAKAYVYDTRFEKAFASDVTDRVLTAFRQHGIEMPQSKIATPTEPAATNS